MSLSISPYPMLPFDPRHPGPPLMDAAFHPDFSAASPTTQVFETDDGWRFRYALDRLAGVSELFRGLASLPLPQTQGLPGGTENDEVDTETIPLPMVKGGGFALALRVVDDYVGAGGSGKSSSGHSTPTTGTPPPGGGTPRPSLTSARLHDPLVWLSDADLCALLATAHAADLACVGDRFWSLYADDDTVDPFWVFAAVAVAGAGTHVGPAAWRTLRVELERMPEPVERLLAAHAPQHLAELGALHGAWNRALHYFAQRMDAPRVVHLSLNHPWRDASAHVCNPSAACANIERFGSSERLVRDLTARALSVLRHPQCADWETQSKDRVERAIRLAARPCRLCADYWASLYWGCVQCYFWERFHKLYTPRHLK